MQRLVTRPWFAPAVIVMLALVVRIAYFEQVRSSPFFERPVFDARDYVGWAQEILSGNLVWDRPQLYPPGYPYFLALVAFLTGGHLPAMTFANALLGCGWILMLTLALRRMFPAPTAELSGLIAATYWGFFHFEAHLLSETWFIFLCVAAFFALTRGERGARPWGSLVAAGLCLGAATITRPNAVASLPFVLALLAMEKPSGVRSRRPLGQTLPVLLSFLVVVTPVVVRTHQLTGLWALRHHMAINVYLGNRPDASGYHTVRPGRDWDRLSSAPEREANAKTLSEHERFFQERVRTFLRERPAEFATLQLRKLGLFFHDHEIRVIFSPYFFERYAPLQAFPLLPRFGWIGALALVGLVLALTRGRAPWLLLCFTVPQTFAVVATVVGSRYRIPVVPFLIPFTALTLACAGDLTLRRRWVALAGIVVSSAAVLAWTNRDLPHVRDLNFAEEMERVAFVRAEDGDPSDAASWWEQALQEDPSRVETYLGYARLALQVGDVVRAEGISRTGLRVAPADADLLRLRGRAFLQMGQADSAAVYLQRALPSQPENGEAWADLGRALHDLGRSEDAVRAFYEAVRLAGEDPSILLDAALVLEEEGRAGKDDELRAVARELLERVVRIDPQQSEARRLLREWAGSPW